MITLQSIIIIEAGRAAGSSSAEYLEVEVLLHTHICTHTHSIQYLEIERLELPREIHHVQGGVCAYILPSLRNLPYVSTAGGDQS